MDITNNSNTSIKTPEAESETPTRIQVLKPIQTNGLLKRHHPVIQPSLSLQPPPPKPLPVFVYRDCLKNHAAHIGGHAVDGCGEFMSSPSSNPTDPTQLKCAACGCHRNFHRRETELNHTRLMGDFHSPHRHQPPPPPPPPQQPESPNSPSPPPISSSYYPTSAPHMLLALSSGPQPVAHHTAPPAPHSRKRFRTKFTHHQKEKMLEFAGKIGWKIQKRDENTISEFCNEIGVDRGVLKVWMHNNKSTLGRNETHGNKKINNNGNENSSSGSEEKMEEHKNNGGANGNNGSSTSS